MAWPLFMIDGLKEKARRFEPGATWFIEQYGPDGDQRDHYLQSLASDEYKRDWAEKRAPLCICLPGGNWWLVDRPFRGVGNHGWSVTGDAPDLTASPSVADSDYHGWLKDGVLSDDLEGRKF